MSLWEYSKSLFKLSNQRSKSVTTQAVEAQEQLDFQEVYDRDPYTSGVNVVARRFEAIVAGKRGGDVETVEQAYREPLTAEDLRGIVEDAAFYAHRVEIHPNRVQTIVTRYMFGLHSRDTDPIVGQTAPVSIDNLNAVALLAVLDTDPDTQRSDRRRQEIELAQANGELPVVQKEDDLFERVGPDVRAQYVRIFGNRRYSDLELCAVTAYALGKGLRREEVRILREEARVSVEEEVIKREGMATMGGLLRVIAESKED